MCGFNLKGVNSKKKSSKQCLIVKKSFCCQLKLFSNISETGRMEDNILEYLTSVPTESDCKSLCRNRTGCFYYTYYLEDDPHQGTCILLTSIIEPTEECQTCVTGKVALKIFSNYENTGEFVLVYNPIRCPKSMSGVTRINDRSY